MATVTVFMDCFDYSIPRFPGGGGNVGIAFCEN